MKKNLFAMAMLVITSYAFSQAGVGIGTQTPQATLDVRSKTTESVAGAGTPGTVVATDGIAVPRVNKLDNNVKGKVDGQLVFLTVSDASFNKGFHSWDTTNNIWAPVVPVTVAKTTKYVTFSGNPKDYVFATNEDVIIFTNRSPIAALTIPDPALYTGRTITIVNLTIANVVGDNPVGKDYVQANSAFIIPYGKSNSFYSDGTKWLMVQGSID